MKLILASASPRRRELFEKLGLDFTIAVSNKEPPTDINGDAEKSAFDSAKIKAEDIYEQNSGAVVVGADTVVSCDGKLLGKPENEENAREMLALLSGREHEVLTAVFVCSDTIKKGFVTKTRVEFYELTQKDIDDYIATMDWTDKAGAYGIQSKAIKLVKGICGDYNNVVGFPAAEFVRFLERENLL